MPEQNTISKIVIATGTTEGSLHHGDCADVLATVAPGAAGLIYLDPPFFTGRTLRQGENSFGDHWNSIDDYLAFMHERLVLCHRCLADDGNLLLHCDWRTSHRLRVILDDLFGAEQFVNALVWTYGLGGSSPRRFARKHDDILLYGRTPDYFFSPPMVPATSNRMRGKMKKATDVIDIPALNNMASERVGYPTQKPLALLDMLVGACAKEGSLVIDPCCGSGTTLVAAARRGHPWMGIDANGAAIKVARMRLTESERTARCEQE